MTGRVLVQQLVHLGRQICSQVRRVEVVASLIDSVVERLTQRLTRSYRIVEETDCLRARDIDCRATNTVNVRGEHAFVTVEELVKMDGSQIHVG